MDFRKKLSILVITGYLFIEVFLLFGLFTNEWIRTNEYNLGLRLYCNDTKHDTSCQNVHDVVDNILPNRKFDLSMTVAADIDSFLYMIDTVFYLSIGACSWAGLVIIVMLLALFCNGCKGPKTCKCASFVMFAWCMIQGAAMTVFVTGFTSLLPASLSDVGWSLYLECTTLCISWFLLIAYVITLCCYAISLEVKNAVSNLQQDILNRISTIMDSRLSSFQSNIRQSQQDISQSQMYKIEQTVTDNYSFKRKGNENQFKHESRVLSKLKEADVNLEGPDLSVDSVQTAKAKIVEGIELVKERQKLIKMADFSELGWKVVSEYVTNTIADDSEDEKKIIRAQNRAERKQKAEKSRKLSQENTIHKREGREYQLFLETWQVLQLVDHDFVSDFDNFCDASDVGFGGYLSAQCIVVTCVDNSEMSGNWTSDEKLESSTWRELECARRVLCTYESKFSLDNKSVSINSDNKNVPHILKVGSKKSILQNIAVDIHNICSEKNITLNSKWLPRADNQYADKLSRNTDNDDWGVNLRRYVEAALVESGVSENCNIYNLARKMTTFLVDSKSEDGYCRDSATVGVLNDIPRFKQPPVDQSVSVGNDVTIHTIVDNANNVIWNKGSDRVIKFSTCHREEFNEANGHANLIITKARFQDDGMYMCIAEKYGKPTKQVRHEIHLNVRPVKPEFLKKLVDTSVDSGELINLEAEVRPSESVTSVKWQHEGEDVISSNGNRKLLCRDGKLILKISNATVKDSGKYSCIAKSKGMSSHEEESISYCHVTVHSALSSAIENVLGDEQVIEGRAPMNHIIHVMHDPNAVYQ
ncbi:unnamed protein product [Mytilus edulis]|uniref:Ig-like domain-containing protein n=1 Tax=Mytilus edulis TaxID=6550 RepID=A0A8S3Q6M5_MYTED|nr:unnamed protein product [Mytilus edulis]